MGCSSRTYTQNALFKLLVALLMFCSGCMAGFTISVASLKKYALAGQNVTFVYTIVSNKDKDGNVKDPDIIRVKIEGKDQAPVIYKLTLENGVTKSVKEMNTDTELKQYKGRVRVSYQKPTLKFYLMNIIDEDFEKKYQVEITNFDILQPFLKDIMLSKAVKPKILDADFFDPDKNQWLNRGGNHKYICRAEGVPGAQVKWMDKKDDKVLASGYQNAILSIENALGSKDTKNYECVAENIGGTDTRILSLLVAHMDYKKDKNDKDIKLQKLSTPLGGKIDAKCGITGYPQPDFKWKDPKGSIIRSSIDLFIGNVNSNQFGNYTCLAKNQFTTLQYMLQVERQKVPPVILDASFFPTATPNRGENHEYICRASGFPSPKIKWIKNKKIFDGAELKFFEIDTDDGGNYACLAENDVGLVNRTMSLTIAYVDYLNKGVSMERVNVTEGDTVTLTCKLTGAPTISYKWLNQFDHVVGADRQFVLGAASLTDGGTYSCEASNSISLLRYEVNVTVKALPTTTTTTTTTAPPTTTKKPSSPKRLKPTKSNEFSSKVVINNAASKDSQNAAVHIPRINPYTLTLLLLTVRLLIAR